MNIYADNTYCLDQAYRRENMLGSVCHRDKYRVFDAGDGALTYVWVTPTYRIIHWTTGDLTVTTTPIGGDAGRVDTMTIVVARATPEQTEAIRVRITILPVVLAAIVAGYASIAGERKMVKCHISK